MDHLGLVFLVLALENRTLEEQRLNYHHALLGKRASVSEEGLLQGQVLLLFAIPVLYPLQMLRDASQSLREMSLKGDLNYFIVTLAVSVDPV